MARFPVKVIRLKLWGTVDDENEDEMKVKNKFETSYLNIR